MERDLPLDNGLPTLMTNIRAVQRSAVQVASAEPPQPLISLPQVYRTTGAIYENLSFRHVGLVLDARVTLRTVSSTAWWFTAGTPAVATSPERHHFARHQLHRLGDRGRRAPTFACLASSMAMNGPSTTWRKGAITSERPQLYISDFSKFLTVSRATIGNVLRREGGGAMSRVVDIAVTKAHGFIPHVPDEP